MHLYIGKDPTFKKLILLIFQSACVFVELPFLPEFLYVLFEPFHSHGLDMPDKIVR